MKTQNLLLSIFVMAQGIMASEAMAFGRMPLNSCLNLFPQSERSPILSSALNRLLEQSNPLAMRSYAALAKFDVSTESAERFRKLSVIQGPRQTMIFAALELLATRRDNVHPSLRLAYSDITRNWLELWISQSERNQDVRHLLDFPQKMIRMFMIPGTSNSKILIQKQKLEGFSDLLKELNSSLKSSGTSDLSFQDLVNTILSKPNPMRKLNRLEQHLLSLSKSRREEFLKTCLP